MLKSLRDVVVRSAFARELVAERPGAAGSSSSARTPHQVLGAHYSHVLPERAPDPRLVAVSRPCAAELGWDVDAILGQERERALLVDVLSGNAPFPSTVRPTGSTSPECASASPDPHPYAACYGGHQFGQWAGQLGDGRAITLGEVEGRDGGRQVSELQLKGAGLTPYSRFADGYAVLRSSVREFLCSEACYHLGIPTSRALSLIVTSRVVQREHPEPGAIVCRLAPSWIRIGSFEILFARRDGANLRRLADFAIDHYFPDVRPRVAAAEGSGDTTACPYWSLCQEVALKTADMIAAWQAYGFCHGVMNTDNFSILGLTIDYGPFQFMDRFEAGYICNHSDPMGLYAFSNQPQIAAWNLERLATALSPLLQGRLQEPAVRREAMIDMLRQYYARYQERYLELMRLRLGLFSSGEGDLKGLVEPLLGLLEAQGLDYHRFFRALSNHVEARAGPEGRSAFPVALHDWLDAYHSRLAQEPARPDRAACMKAVNPKYVLRNHLAQRVIEQAEAGDYSGISAYLARLERPFEAAREETAVSGEEENDPWDQEPPPGAGDTRCSCSS